MKLLHETQPYNLFGLEDQDYEHAKVAVLEVPYDSTTTYKSGARDGPHAIIEASRSLELYSEEFDADISKKIGVYTLGEMEPSLNSPEETVNRIEKEVSLVLEDGKVPLLLGGEHTVAIGAIRAVSKKYGNDLTIIHFDAHSDYRDEYAGSKYCHACVMARAHEACPNCYSIGVRSTDEESAKRHGSEILYRKDMHAMGVDEVIKRILERSKGKYVYLTVDLDVLDPGIMPSTGTPEPDGLSFHELISIIKGVLEERTLVGMDLCELAPIGGVVAPNCLAAKLAYLSLGYAFLGAPATTSEP